MFDEWQETTIGQQVTLQRGVDITKAQQRIGSVPVVSSGGISSHHDTAHAKGPGVVLGRKGTLGTVFFIQENYWPHDTTLWVRDFHGNDPRFVYYFFKSMSSTLSALDVGTSNPTLNRNHIHPIRVSWPTPDEQRAIARTLGALDDKIELNRQMNRTLEAMVQALFKSWFVDFDPVTAKAAGRKPYGMNEANATLFPNDFEDSKLGTIPKGWNVSQIKDLGSVICGKTPSTREPANFGSDIPFITIPDMHGVIFVTETERSLSIKGADSQAKKYLPENSICVSCIATPGLVSITSKISQTNQQINSVIPQAEISPYFCYWLLRNLGDEIRAGGSAGTVFHNLNTGNFSQIETLIPSQALIDAFHSSCEGMMKKILENQQQSQTLSNLRDLLLPKLLSGEIRVLEAEKLVAEAV